MVPVKIETLIVGLPPSPSVVVLRPVANEHGGERVLPIWIGPTEAASIGIALEGQTQARPMTHDFLVNTILALGAKVERVVIDRVANTTFFATVYLSREGRVFNIDARPSDSIALAVRTTTPVYVDEDVINSNSFPYDFKASGKPHENTMDEFRSFLDSISPEDFQVTE
jgi:bifunctional DNase/RNase